MWTLMLTLVLMVMRVGSIANMDWLESMAGRASSLRMRVCV